MQPRPRHFGHLHQSLTHARSANIASLLQSSVAEHPTISLTDRSGQLATWAIRSSVPSNKPDRWGARNDLR